MDADAAGQQAKPGGDRGFPLRAGDPSLEPAHRAGALTADQDPLAPALPQDLVEAVGPPDRDQVHHAAPAGVDHVLREQLVAQIDRIVGRAGRARSPPARSRARRRPSGSGRSDPRDRRSPSAAGRSAAGGTQRARRSGRRSRRCRPGGRNRARRGRGCGRIHTRQLPGARAGSPSPGPRRRGTWSPAWSPGSGCPVARACRRGPPDARRRPRPARRRRNAARRRPRRRSPPASRPGDCDGRRPAGPHPRSGRRCEWRRKPSAGTRLTSPW